MRLPACDNYTTLCVCAAGKTLRNLRTSKRCKARSFDSGSLARGHSEFQVSRNNPGNPLSISACLPSFNISNSLYQYQLLTNSSNSNNIPNFTTMRSSLLSRNDFRVGGWTYLKSRTRLMNEHVQKHICIYANIQVAYASCLVDVHRMINIIIYTHNLFYNYMQNYTINSMMNYM